MSVAAQPLLRFESTLADALPELHVPWQAAQAPAPRLLVLNDALAAELGADPEALRAEPGVAALVGNTVVERSAPVAQAYAGHQFGGWVPRLGDGRALLLGEVVDVHGHRRDVHLKGSGRTPFARAGDGKAVVGPMLREYVVAEALHALGIPTTRALAVVATGEEVSRGPMLPGAVLARVAASHLRVGTFQYAAAQGDGSLVRRLADHAIARHHPDVADAAEPYLALLERVVEVQASLVARWMLVGFVHGVMNTDNMTISGETIDLGPCAFMDAYDPATVFSSIDQGGRYAFANQPHAAQWNLARFAETLLPLLGADTGAAVETATAVVRSYPARFHAHWLRGMTAKLGLADGAPDAESLGPEVLALLHAQRVDHTSFFRALAAGTARDLFVDRAPFEAWAARWSALGPDRAAMDRVNPVYIPRNHLVEGALTAATVGDLDPVHRLLDVVTRPYDERPGLEAYAEPAPDADVYRTYCGT